MEEIGGWDDASKTISCRVLRTCIHLHHLGRLRVSLSQSTMGRSDGSDM